VCFENIHNACPKILLEGRLRKMPVSRVLFEKFKQNAVFVDPELQEPLHPNLKKN